jgi:hypothetical protein
MVIYSHPLETTASDVAVVGKVVGKEVRLTFPSSPRAALQVSGFPAPTVMATGSICRLRVAGRNPGFFAFSVMGAGANSGSVAWPPCHWRRPAS